jgi:hypothetical protein
MGRACSGAKQFPDIAYLALLSPEGPARAHGAHVCVRSKRDETQRAHYGSLRGASGYAACHRGGFGVASLLDESGCPCLSTSWDRCRK